MSKEGIKRFAAVLEQMQMARHELIESGGKACGTFDGNQDIRLGQLLDRAKDAVQDEFCQITMEVRR